MKIASSSFVLRRLGALPVLLLFGVLPLRSEEPAASFLLETITIEGAQPAAARIVRAESLLEEGHSYSEEDLRQAVYRIQRLPIVLESSFALRKGSERGAYELVIQVRQARRFFFDHSIRSSHFAEPVALDSAPGVENSVSLPGLVGVRQFVGRTGLLFGALDSKEGVQAGYTQYDLLGRGIVASIGYSWGGACCTTEVVPYGLDPGFTAWGGNVQERASLSLVVPLNGSHSLQIGLFDRRGDVDRQRRILEPQIGLPGEEFLDADEVVEQRLTARWVYDTTDDPLLPTRGLSLSAGIEAGALSIRGLRLLRFGDDPFGPPQPRPRSDAETVSAVLAVVRYWPVTPRQTVSANGRLSAGHSWLENVQLSGDEVTPGDDVDVDVYGASAGIQHTVSLWRGRQPGGFGDLRLETSATIGHESTAPDLGIATTPLTRLEVSTGLVFRNQWGRLRWQVTYLDFQGDTP
jgi:hypothetical protein